MEKYFFINYLSYHFKKQGFFLISFSLISFFFYIKDNLKKIEREFLYKRKKTENITEKYKILPKKQEKINVNKKNQSGNFNFRSDYVFAIVF